MVFYIVLLMLVLIILRIPIFFSVGIGTTLFCLLENIDTIIVPQRMFVTLDVFTFLAIPFFLLAGNLMNVGGVTQRILNLSRSAVGHITGGLGHVNVVASMIFAGLSGSAIADAAGLGSIELKMMTESGYDKDFSSAITVASATIGPIIPPSIILVVYGIASNTSIGRLLIAGVLPGVVMGLCLMVMVYIISRMRNYPVDAWAGFRRFLHHLMRSLLPLFTPIIIVGGIISGIFTPTEAGAVAAVYALILGVFVYREIKWTQLRKVFLDTAISTSIIGIVIAVCGIFSWVLTLGGVPQEIVKFVFSLTTNKLLILALLNVLVLILGCFIDAAPLILLLVPVLLPLLTNSQIDLVHFGIIICVNTMIGTITPPVGTCLYAISAVADLPLERIAVRTLPFLLMLVIALAIVTFVPWVSLFLPSLFFH